MKKLLISFWACLLCFVLAGCSGGYTPDKTGFEKLNRDLKDKFGEDAYYTSISLSKGGDGNAGYIVAVDKTDKPDSYKQEKWIKAGGTWELAANVTLEVKGGKPVDFMFQLDKEINLAQLGNLIEESKKNLAEKKQITETRLNLAIVSTNNTVLSKSEKITYTVILGAGSSADTYSFTYNLQGKLVNSNY